MRPMYKHMGAYSFIVFGKSCFCDLKSWILLLILQNATIPDHSLWKDRTTPEEIGNEFLHDLVVTAIDIIESCLQTNGINECIVTDRHSAFGHDLLALMISASCYAPFIRQVLKFIPKVGYLPICTITLPPSV